MFSLSPRATRLSPIAAAAPSLSQSYLRQILVGSRVSLVGRASAPSCSVQLSQPPGRPGPVHSPYDRWLGASTVQSVQDIRWRATLLVGAHAPSGCGQAADRPNAQRKPHRRDIATISAVELQLVSARETPPSLQAIARSAPSCDRCGPAHAPPVAATDRERTPPCLSLAYSPAVSLRRPLFVKRETYLVFPRNVQCVIFDVQLNIQH